MTLKEELEILRGEPIEVFTGDPMDIPCIETSDPEKLCKHPVVSVHMTTYNHEPYIRQAIEGVMMQKTNFEFELVIGEDCSQDKTREICFEYRKKYPDKIRVLWWHENVSKLGGNGRRIRAHCRGEFIAYCDGDDYWIDPLKLQKQVDYIRETGSVMCVANSEWRFPDGRVVKDIYREERGLLTLDDFLDHYFHTTTYLVNRAVLVDCMRKYSEVIFWYDCAVATFMATMGRACFLPDVVSVYNWTGHGAGGCLDSLERAILLALQHTQFAYCFNSKIADYYASRAVNVLFPYILHAVTREGHRYPQEIRSRVWRVSQRLCSHCYGRIFRWRHNARCWWREFAVVPIMVFYIRHPHFGIAWRSCKRIFRVGAF